MEEISFTDTIKLLPPDLNGGINLMSAFNLRKSSRDFEKNAKKLTLKQLSEIMWVAYGQSHGENNKLKTVASAVALFPLEIYALFSEGIYKYDPIKNELNIVVKGDYTDKVGMQDFAKNAFLNILVFADKKKRTGNPHFDDMLDANPIKKRECALLDAGHVMQNVYLYCASEGLKCVERGSTDAEFFEKLLQLTHHSFMISQSIGN